MARTVSSIDTVRSRIQPHIFWFQTRPMHIAQTENGPSVLYDGTRIIAYGSQELCEAVRNGTLNEYISRCEEERQRLKIGFHSPRVQRQLAQEAAAAQGANDQADLFT